MTVTGNEVTIDESNLSTQVLLERLQSAYNGLTSYIQEAKKTDRGTSEEFVSQIASEKQWIVSEEQRIAHYIAILTSQLVSNQAS